MHERHPIKIPSEVETVRYTFLKEIFEENFESLDKVTSVIAGVITLPLMIVGQALEGIKNGLQSAQNLTARKELEFLQYCIAIYEYLDRENGIVD